MEKNLIDEWDILLTPKITKSTVNTVPSVLVTCTYKDEKVTRAKVKFNKKAVELMNLTKNDKITFLYSNIEKYIKVVKSDVIQGIDESWTKKLFNDFSTRIDSKEYKAIYKYNTENIGENWHFNIEVNTVNKNGKEFNYYTFTKLQKQAEKKERGARSTNSIAQQNKIKEWCKAQKEAGKPSTVKDYWKVNKTK
jgi:hypothetical protein